jgi:hypothetical protein
MNGKHDLKTRELEARLDRSLQKQIKVPQLGRRFDAAVWARIEAAEARATNPGLEIETTPVLRATRWLAVSNAIGGTVAVVLVLWFALRFFAGADLNVDVGISVPAPRISEEMVTQIVSVLGYVLGFATLAFGLGLTSFGRRLRSAFS